MTEPRRWSLLIASAALILAAVPVAAADAPGRPVDVTETPLGRMLAAEAGERHRTLNASNGAQKLRVWRVGPGDHVVGDGLPANLATPTRTLPDGRVRLELRFDTAALTRRAATTTATTTPRWSPVGGTCFSRVSTTWGWLDSCYKMHRLIGETDATWDYYQLEQYGSVAAKEPGKIYDGWLHGKKAGATAMYWVDWSPRGTISGGCVTVPISVSALGFGISASGLMCERWDIYKAAAGGDFKEQWGCGCIVPFGQPYPNIREIDLMQAVKVIRNASPSWTLSGGFTAIAR
ncbi:MAG: hypothetical protein K0S92_677 [Desertimonas sp.]|nr:hypothetical protein [Desertimonas sp.]